ncbi:MAG: ABC transporter ATP-binding protein [Chloroflexota bacterium]|nr:ABC transporter ATP-binding protein [Chloroflexota bacterium]
MSAPEFAVECIDLTKTYDRQPVLRGVSLRVKAGQIVALLGPSGCGKTTTLRMIAGFETPDGGSVLIDGRVVADARSSQPAEVRRVGMVFQEYALFPHLNVYENVAFGLRGNQKAARVAEMLTLVGLGGLDKRMPHELSGGQQQRVALARALAPAPRVLLLDEPFSNLDTALRAQVRTEISAILRQAGITAILVTHDQEEALSLADEVAVMFEGQVAQVAEPQTLYRQPTSRAVAAFVGEANFLPAKAHGMTARCALGDLTLDEHASGAVDVLLRPEQLQLVTSNDGAGRVLWREFYGHTQRIGVSYGDLALVARADAIERYTPGQTVNVVVRGRARAFGG